MASKRIRFDVFKRDDFTCQYCGRTPPGVVLEVDHINPRAGGGRDCIDNYITACSDCNRGKGKYALTDVPPGVEDRLAAMIEKRAQLKAFNRLIEEQEQEYEKDICSVNEIFSEAFPDQELSDSFNRGTVRRFLTRLPLVRVNEAMALACSRKQYNPDAALKYFCGVCWNWIKNPETRSW